MKYIWIIQSVLVCHLQVVNQECNILCMVCRFCYIAINLPLSGFHFSSVCGNDIKVIVVEEASIVHSTIEEVYKFELDFQIFCMYTYVCNHAPLNKIKSQLLYKILREKKANYMAKNIPSLKWQG